MNEEAIRQVITTAIEGAMGAKEDPSDAGVYYDETVEILQQENVTEATVATFKDVGMMTSDEGMLLKLNFADKEEQEYEVTIVRRK